MTDFYTAAPGEIAPPVPDGPKLCSGSEMRILHNAFLWTYGRAAGLIRGVDAGDTARSAFVGQWLADLGVALHVHHEGEDELLWSPLEQRAPSCALHVAQMRAQHATVQAQLAEADALLAEWMRTADPATGARLAAAFDEIYATLTLHLRREVVEIVPIAEKVMTKEEWAKLGEHGQGAIPMSRLLPQLGFLLASSPEAERKAFWAESLPMPPKVLYRLVGKRRFEAQYRTLFPGEPVPATV
jgi:hypothetical protein